MNTANEQKQSKAPGFWASLVDSLESAATSPYEILEARIARLEEYVRKLEARKSSS